MKSTFIITQLAKDRRKNANYKFIVGRHGETKQVIITMKEKMLGLEEKKRFLFKKMHNILANYNFLKKFVQIFIYIENYFWQCQFEYFKILILSRLEGSTFFIYIHNPLPGFRGTRT